MKIIVYYKKYFPCIEHTFAQVGNIIKLSQFLPQVMSDCD